MQINAEAWESLITLLLGNQFMAGMLKLPDDGDYHVTCEVRMHVVQRRIMHVYTYELAYHSGVMFIDKQIIKRSVKFGPDTAFHVTRQLSHLPEPLTHFSVTNSNYSATLTDSGTLSVLDTELVDAFITSGELVSVDTHTLRRVPVSSFKNRRLRPKDVDLPSGVIIKELLGFRPDSDHVFYKSGEAGFKGRCVVNSIYQLSDGFQFCDDAPDMVLTDFALYQRNGHLETEYVNPAIYAAYFNFTDYNAHFAHNPLLIKYRATKCPGPQKTARCTTRGRIQGWLMRIFMVYVVALMFTNTVVAFHQESRNVWTSISVVPAILDKVDFKKGVHRKRLPTDTKPKNMLGFSTMQAPTSGVFDSHYASQKP